MRKLIIGLAVVTALSVASSPAMAYEHHKRMGIMETVCSKIPGVCAKMQEQHTKKTPTAQPVPEIDAANAGLVLALLGGLVAIRREHRGRKQA